MALIEELKGMGVNTDEALERVMEDAGLYEEMLGMFLESVRDYPIAMEEFDADLEPLIKKVHLLKGITGNLSLTPLFVGYNKALGFLREGHAEPAREELERLLPIQEEIIGCIRRHQTVK